MGFHDHQPSGTLLLLSIVATVGAWLAADQCDELCPAPKITSVQASLPDLQVAPASGMDPKREFRLRAWYRDANGDLIAGRFTGMDWSFDPSTDGGVDASGIVTVRGFPTGATASEDATLQARSPSDASLFADVSVTRWRDVAAAAASGAAVDVSGLAHAVYSEPRVALVEEKNSGKCEWAKAHAFVGAGAVGQQSDIPCSLTVLSADKAVLFHQGINDAGWRHKGHIVQPTLQAPLDLKVTVFIAITGGPAIGTSNTDALVASEVDRAERTARSDVERANSLFEINRVGIRIDADFVRLSANGGDLAAKVGAHPFDCFKPPSLTAPSTDPDYAYEPTTISVYYVDWIDYPDDPLHPGSRGVQCPFWGTGNPGPVVYVSFTRHSSVTLAHEIGHALGLSDEESELGVLNVMYSLAPDGPLGANARSQFTVGQVFRMNIWNWSYLTVGSTTVPKRFCDVVEPCPTVSFDVR